MIRKYTSIIGCLMLSIICLGQQDTTKPKYWLSLGVGNYLDDSETGGFNASLDVNLLSLGSIYKARYYAHEELLIFVSKPEEKFHSAGFLYGKGYDGKYFQVFFSGGLGLVYGIVRGNELSPQPASGWWSSTEYEKIKFVTPSIPLEIDMLFKPFRFLGTGITLYADLNIKKSLYGISVKIATGKLR